MHNGSWGYPNLSGTTVTRSPLPSLADLSELQLLKSNELARRDRWSLVLHNKLYVAPNGPLLDSYGYHH